MAMTDTRPDSVTGAPAEPTVFDGGWTGGTDHKAVGKLYIVAALVFLVAGGVVALVMRAQLATPDADIVGRNTYRQLFTMHGVTMVFLFLLPVWLGLATAIVPLQLGATRMAFPRAHALSFWLFLGGAVMVVAAPFVSDLLSGWTLSDPIPERLGLRGNGPDWLILGMGLVAAAGVVASVNLTSTILSLRVEGLTLRRVPPFTWSVLVSSSVLMLALPVLIAALTMLVVDRHYAGHVFDGWTGSRGGNPLMWPRMFWFAAYPTLWALLLPALGAISEIVPVFARRRLADHRRAILALTAVGVLAFAGWGSEVRTLSRARPLFALGALAVLAPVASLVLNWLLTLRGAGRDPGARRRMRRMPMLHAVGFVSVLAVGLGGGVISAIDAGRRSHSNYWAVAEQHTLFFGAATVGAVAALYYWAPKLWGRHLSEGIGSLQFLALVGGLHLTFLPMYVLGIQDMGVHIPVLDADEDWELANLAASAGAAVVGLGLLLLVANLVGSLVAGRGARAEDDPWEGHTLEWATTSPPPVHNFDDLPVVRSEAPLLDRHAASLSDEEG